MTTLTATPDLETASVGLLVETSGVPASFARDYRGATPTSGELGEWAPQGGATVSAWPSAVQFTGGVDGGGRIVVTGLTASETYRVRLYVRRGNANVTGVKFGVGSYSTVVPPTMAEPAVAFETTFTAAGTTANLDVLVASLVGGSGNVFVNAVQVWPDGEILADWDLVALVRTDANGTRSVRLPATVTLTTGAFLVTDSEAALSGPLTYAVTVHDAESDTTDTATATTTLDGVTNDRLAPAVLPTLAVALELMPWDQYNVGHASSSTVHEVIGRADPLVTVGPLRTRSGSYQVWCEDYAAAQAIVSLCRRGDVLLLRHVAGPTDMYHLPTGVSTPILTPNPQHWAVTVEFVEVAAPAAPLLGSVGWTFGASTARNATFGDSSAEFPTFLDLLVGPVA